MLRFSTLAVIGSALVLVPAVGYGQSRIIVCGTNIRCDESGRSLPDRVSPRPDPEQERRAAEARRRAAALDDEFARRRSDLKTAATLSAHRAAEAERIRRMEYDAMIARQRARGCWVPGDPPGTGKNCVQSY